MVWIPPEREYKPTVAAAGAIFPTKPTITPEIARAGLSYAAWYREYIGAEIPTLAKKTPEERAVTKAFAEARGLMPTTGKWIKPPPAELVGAIKYGKPIEWERAITGGYYTIPERINRFITNVTQQLFPTPPPEGGVDWGKWLLYGGLALGGIYLLGKWLGRKK